MKLRFTIRDLFWLVLVASSFGCSAKSQPIVDPLPSLGEVKTIEAQVDDTTTGKQSKFPLEQSHWQAVFDAMRPATLDANPVNWQVLGGLDITRKDGDRLTVDLFEVSNGPGAFAVEENQEGRKFYRGGDSAKLKRLLSNPGP